MKKMDQLEPSSLHRLWRGECILEREYHMLANKGFFMNEGIMRDSTKKS